MSDTIKSWWSAHATVDAAAAEAVEFALNEAGAIGTEIDLLGKREPGIEIVVTGYFDQIPNEADLREHIAIGLAIHNSDENALKLIETKAVEERDWLAEWKKHWRPTEIGNFVVAPPWFELAESDKTVIRVEPNMAFGTGTHETTQMCLKAISERYDPAMSVLDVGTGTGILAIATAKLGGTNIVACDTDRDSVTIARENAVLNNVGEQIDFFNGSIDESTPQFDFVCANLTIDVIAPILVLLIAKSARILLLSGILAEQEQQIGDALHKSEITDSKFKVERAGEWISVIVAIN